MDADEKIKKMVNENGPWTTETKFWNWVRGGLRRALWNRHPNKILLINRARFKAPLGKNKAEVWCLECEMCGAVKRQGDCQVDHIVPAGSLKSFIDLTPFVQKLILVSLEDLRILCKPCHSTVTYAERYGVSLEDAAKRKKEIAKKKDKGNER